MFIIDASVVIKWFIEEEDSARAVRLKDEHANGKTILIAPDLLIYEVANVLAFSRIFTAAEVKKAIQDLYDLEIDLISPSPDILMPAVELATEKHVSIYDACYIALAKDLDITLITADRKLYASVGSPRNLKLLSEI